MTTRIAKFKRLNKQERFNVLMGVINERLFHHVNINVFAIEHYRNNPNKSIFN